MSRRSRLALSLWLVLLSGLQGSAEPRAADGFVGSFVWRMPDDAFGGFSAIEVLDSGARFVAISDKAALVSGQIKRDASGKIIGIKAGQIMPLLAAKKGKRLEGRRADSEGLAIGPDGSAYLSFENRPRVAQLALATGKSRDLPAHPDFASLPRNGALEALAIDDYGRLYTLPEESQGAEAFPIYRWNGTDWDKLLSIPKSGRFLPVAADFGPDGRFYLMERDFRGIAGFSTRLRRFDLTMTGFVNEITLLKTPFSLHDNLEGLSVWRDQGGALRATMISDDNFILLQRTELVEYRLPD